MALINPEEREEAIQAAAKDAVPEPEKLSGSQAQDLLIRSLLAREARNAAKEIADDDARIARAQQRALNTKNRNIKLFTKQSRCTHLKGGKIKSKTGVKDYALFHHTYINKDQTIGCFICKMRWKPQDTVEYLVRNGRKKRNHTRIGWLEANELFSQSSNTPSMSEIPQTIDTGSRFVPDEDLGEASPE